MTKTKNSITEVYELALQAAPSGILVVDDAGEIRYTNQTLADMFGYRVEELVDEPVEILIPDQFAAAHRRHMENYARAPRSRDMGTGRDLEGITRDGIKIPLEIGLRPTQTSSGPVVVATVVDITVRKAIEDRLLRHEQELEQLVAERTRELEDAQREKERMLDQLIQAEKMTTVGTLVSGIGHEINNPLYALHAAAEALADETDIECCRAYGRDILKQATRIAETVKNLSRYAQPGTRHDLQPVDLAQVVEEAVRLAHQSLNDEQIEFEITDGRVAEISARFEEIMQLVFNLLRNAIQAIPGQGRIQIVTQQDGNFVSLRIQDNGSGIPREHLKRVFDPFFTTKGPDKGEGLGLYIVRQIIIRYGGEIEVDNVDDGGARFKIRFPVANRVDKPEE
ncbi:MAG: ATP-binding protein [Gammaproteobacteria bacterium]|nr:ATP-binding protein [Gammaproteobacteria bacterium]